MEDDEYDDQDTIPPDIMRVMQDINQSWRRCRRKSCKRARSCRAAGVICANERAPRVPPRNANKDARDDARAMAIFQRMLHERLDEGESAQPRAPARQTAKAPRRRKY